MIIVLTIAVLVYWGITTNWGKSFDAEEASRYCYTACVERDRIKYCTPDIIVNFEHSKWGNVSCHDLEMNNISHQCPDISCP